MVIETFDQIATPNSWEEALKIINAAFELEARKPGSVNLTKLHMKVCKYFPRERIARLANDFQKAKRVKLGFLGKRGMAAGLEYIEYAAREHLAEIVKRSEGKKVSTLVAENLMQGIHRSLQNRGISIGLISPNALAKAFRKVNAELGSPVLVIAANHKELGKMIRKAPRLTQRSKTNIMRTARHPPPRRL